MVQWHNMPPSSFHSHATLEYYTQGIKHYLRGVHGIFISIAYAMPFPQTTFTSETPIWVFQGWELALDSHTISVGTSLATDLFD